MYLNLVNVNVVNFTLHFELIKPVLKFICILYNFRGWSLIALKHLMYVSSRYAIHIMYTNNTLWKSTFEFDFIPVYGTIDHDFNYVALISK